MDKFDTNFLLNVTHVTELLELQAIFAYICHYLPGRVLLQSDVNGTVAHVANTLLSTQEKLLPLVFWEHITKLGKVKSQKVVISAQSL